jgi:hypothetical protein
MLPELDTPERQKYMEPIDPRALLLFNPTLKLVMPWKRMEMSSVKMEMIL